MDWTLATQRNRTALLAIVAALWAMTGAAARAMTGRRKGDGAAFPDRAVMLAFRRILRPAESAVRRLIVIVAARMRVRPKANAQRPTPDFSRFAARSGDRPPTFALFDTPWRLVPRPAGRRAGGIPRVLFLDWNGTLGLPAAAAGAQAGDERDGRSLLRRLAALHHALNTLPAQARRLKRVMARRETAAAAHAPGKTVRPLPLGPMRPGRPPGHRGRAAHPVDHILAECHGLALAVAHAPP